MGDRWRPSLLGSSRYIWYPLDFSSGNPSLVHADVWSVNVQAGTFQNKYLPVAKLQPKRTFLFLRILKEKLREYVNI